MQVIDGIFFSPATRDHLRPDFGNKTARVRHKFKFFRVFFGRLCDISQYWWVQITIPLKVKSWKCFLNMFKRCTSSLVILRCVRKKCVKKNIKIISRRHILVFEMQISLCTLETSWITANHYLWVARKEGKSWILLSRKHCKLF